MHLAKYIQDWQQLKYKYCQRHNGPEGPVLKICFGPPTAESKNLKNHVNFNVGDLFLGPQPFGPPKMSLVLRPPVAWSLILRTGTMAKIISSMGNAKCPQARLFELTN